MIKFQIFFVVFVIVCTHEGLSQVIVTGNEGILSNGYYPGGILNNCIGLHCHEHIQPVCPQGVCLTTPTIAVAQPVPVTPTIVHQTVPVPVHVPVNVPVPVPGPERVVIRDHLTNPQLIPVPQPYHQPVPVPNYKVQVERVPYPQPYFVNRRVQHPVRVPHHTVEVRTQLQPDYVQFEVPRERVNIQHVPRNLPIPVPDPKITTVPRDYIIQLNDTVEYVLKHHNGTRVKSSPGYPNNTSNQNVVTRISLTNIVNNNNTVHTPTNITSENFNNVTVTSSCSGKINKI